MTDSRYTALVLAASRGNLDPLAQAGGVSHKTFIDVAGVPMLERVVRSVVESGRIGRVVISIEEDSADEAKRMLSGIDGAAEFIFVPSRANIGTSASKSSARRITTPPRTSSLFSEGLNGLRRGELLPGFRELGVRLTEPVGQHLHEAPDELHREDRLALHQAHQIGAADDHGARGFDGAHRR